MGKFTKNGIHLQYIWELILAKKYDYKVLILVI